MANVLYLVHRLPYPPNKGDKVRSYHLLRHLASKHQVFLGTFVDDPVDRVHLPRVKEFCAQMCAVELSPKVAKVKSLSGLLTGQPLTICYYSNHKLKKWVQQVIAEHGVDAVVVFSSAMGQFAENIGTTPLLVDFVDVDSAKWSQYGQVHRWPMSWLFRREARELLGYERQLAKRSLKSFLVTEQETQVFCDLAPECAGNIETVSNGVDSDFFSPLKTRDAPFDISGIESSKSFVVFTGAMDYWPNVDAVCWFAREVLPALHARRPNIFFYIVGRSPPASVLALASDKVVVTGTVPDVRPYLQYASVVVAPLRIARGIQNKILEAMAMGRPVVASKSCAQAMDVKVGEELLSAESVDDYVQSISMLLDNPLKAQTLGEAGRQRVVCSYSWAAHLGKLDAYLPSSSRHLMGSASHG
jgi:polysaccharide biosynthesis protein PslH